MVTKDYLMSRFKTGMKPTEKDFQDLIELLSQDFIEDIKNIKYYEEVIVDLDLKLGHLASSNGVMPDNIPQNTAWRSTPDIFPNGIRTFKTRYVKNDDNPHYRILEYKNGIYQGLNPHIECGLPFTLRSDTTSFKINLGATGATPNSIPPVPLFNTVDDIYRFQVYYEVERNEEIKERIDIDYLYNEMKEIKGLKPKKILMVGNSFSEDILQHINDICLKAKVNVIIGNLYRPGESLEGHLNQIRNNSNGYQYHLRKVSADDKSYEIINNVRFLDILRSEEWDYICYQQSSPNSGIYSTFTPLNEIKRYVDDNKNNNDLKHVLHMTWAYPTTSTENAFNNYNRDQIQMYNAIVSAYRKAMQDYDIDILLPVGTAIQNARNEDDLKNLDNNMASDGFHLGNMGDYIGALVLFYSLIKNEGYINLGIESKYHSYLALNCVKNSLLNPFNAIIR